MNHKHFPVALTGHRWYSYCISKLDDLKKIVHVLLSLHNLKVNTVIVHLMFCIYYVFEGRELPQMFRLWSLQESHELRSAEWLERNLERILVAELLACALRLYCGCSWKTELRTGHGPESSSMFLNEPSLSLTVGCAYSPSPQVSF